VSEEDVTITPTTVTTEKGSTR